MNAKEQAEQDIRVSLRAAGKCFIGFSSRYNRPSKVVNPTPMSPRTVKPKFKKGDIIKANIPGRGFERAKVLSIFTATQGKYQGRTMYLLEIVCGTASIPIDVQGEYHLQQDS